MKNAQVSRWAGKSKHAIAHPVRLKVFVAYADLPAFRHATAAIGEGMRSSGRKVDLDPMLWQYKQLASPHWRERALAAALQADIVVLASSAADKGTISIDPWIIDFLEAARGRRTTLVVISGPADAWTISIEHPLAKAQPTLAREQRISAQKLVA